MKKTIEKIYILENPEKNIVKFATDYQLRYDNIIKDVFGVACLSDLDMMIQFNKTFQESISQKLGISEKKVSLHTVVRIASKNELLRLKKEMLAAIEQNKESETLIPCPFDSIIQLQDGIFKWDAEISSYIPVTQIA
ncbi:hypothetical protein [Neobacillus kokaensis]|uniref:Uncharacterized protein n=1 Tax=Neobacillus kokaensis TaxID=2759023 RepID=A0ABQ3N5Y8_9BACI|nr:hypothetical protein [Neobacillus kokaensis]GHH99007.1 hypothetical protein AM1BK_25500 [Neobacillus kokaensis]